MSCRGGVQFLVCDKLLMVAGGSGQDSGEGETLIACEIASH